MEIIEPIGTFIAMVVVFPAMVVLMFPFMGILSLVALSPFSWLYVGIIGLLFTVQLIIPKGIRNITRAGLSLGVILMWLSLVVSNKNLPYNYIDFSNPAPAAIGGFPITAFEYPLGALGSNVPPTDSWGLFYLNLGFWIILGAAVSIILRKYFSRQVSFKLFASSAIISLCGLGYLMLKFD